MRRVAMAFTGAALFCQGFGTFVNIRDEKIQTPAPSSTIDPISAVLKGVVDPDGTKSVNPLDRGTGACSGDLSGVAAPRLSLGMHTSFDAITSSPMGYFTTSRGKFRKHFS